MGCGTYTFQWSTQSPSERGHGDAETQEGQERQEDTELAWDLPTMRKDKGQSVVAETNRRP